MRQETGYLTAEVKLKTDPKYRTRDGLREHPLYLSCARLSVFSFIPTSRPIAKSWPRPCLRYLDDEIARVVANRHLSNWRIKYLIVEHRGDPATEVAGSMSKRELPFNCPCCVDGSLRTHVPGNRSSTAYPTSRMRSSITEKRYKYFAKSKELEKANSDANAGEDNDDEDNR